jgi:hypothetical protein
MALWAVQSAQTNKIPAHVRPFLQRHEEEEAEHLQEFERRLGVTSKARVRLPRVARQWPTLAVHLLGYESLGLEFAKLLMQVQPALGSILDDERAHVEFFERQVTEILAGADSAAESARTSARAWWRKLPRTVDRYLDAESLSPFRSDLRDLILTAIRTRFASLGLVDSIQLDPYQ